MHLPPFNHDCLLCDICWHIFEVTPQLCSPTFIIFNCNEGLMVLIVDNMEVLASPLPDAKGVRVVPFAFGR